MARGGQTSSSKIEALGRANKTEVVQIRIDPKQRFVLEMLARTHDRSVSSIVEEALRSWQAKEHTNVVRDAEHAWSPLVVERFVRQAQLFPNTLTYQESVLFHLIADKDEFWFGRTRRPRPLATRLNCDFKLLDQEWESLCDQTLERLEQQAHKQKTREYVASVTASDLREPTPGHELDSTPQEEE